MSVSMQRLPCVMKRTGLPRSTIYKLINEDKFPRPVKLSERSSAWVEQEITDWINSRIAKSRPLPDSSEEA